MQDPSLHLILLGLVISTQKSKKPLFVKMFYHGYHLSYVKEPSQCPGIWNQKNYVLQTQNDKKTEKNDPVSWKRSYVQQF